MVWIYVDSRHPVGHPEHLKVFASEAVANAWFRDNDPEGVAFAYEVIGPLMPVYGSKPLD